jgi:hypothetical protein
MAFENSKEFLREALLLPGQDALKRHLESQQRNIGKTMSLWRASELAAEYIDVFKPRAVYNCARELQANAEFVPTTVAGRKTCANDPTFLAALKSAILERDVPGQAALIGPELEKFVRDFQQKHYALNPHATMSKMPSKTLKKIKTLVKIKGQKIHYVSARRYEAMGDPRNYVPFWCASFLAFRGVPLELRFNWDDTSIYLSSDMRDGGNRFVGLAWTTQEQLNLISLCPHSPGLGIG